VLIPSVIVISSIRFLGIYMFFLSQCRCIVIRCDLVTCSDGVFRQSSKERKTSSPDSRAFFINPFMVFAAFSTLPLDVGYLGELVS